VFAAIDKLTGLKGSLHDFTVRSLTVGADAVGEVFVHVDFAGSPATGRAASTDIVDASARAYLNAVNKLVHARRLPAQATASA
jgi:2-isopropylmalate synthase